MRKGNCVDRALSALVIVAFLMTQSFARPAFASVVERTWIATPELQDPARARIHAFLERADVRAQLEALGVDPREAQARVAALSDAEVRQIDSKLDELPAGKGFIGFLVAVILIIVLLFLILDLLGYTDVFTFIKPMPRGKAR